MRRWAGDALSEPDNVPRRLADTYLSDMGQLMSLWEGAGAMGTVVGDSDAPLPQPSGDAITQLSLTGACGNVGPLLYGRSHFSRKCNYIFHIQIFKFTFRLQCEISPFLNGANSKNSNTNM